jgi:hypothetical protein
MQYVKFHTLLFGEPHREVEVPIIDFHNNEWTIRFGDYGNMYEVKATNDDLEELVAVLSAMLIESEQEEAAKSGDYESYGEDEPKWDEKQTEAWLDTEG